MKRFIIQCQEVLIPSDAHALKALKKLVIGSELSTLDHKIDLVKIIDIAIQSISLRKENPPSVSTFPSNFSLHHCIKFSIEGKEIPQQVLANAIKNYTRDNIEKFIDNEFEKLRSNPDNLNKPNFSKNMAAMINLFFQHASMVQQQDFISRCLNRSIPYEHLFTQILLALPQNIPLLSLTYLKHVEPHNWVKIISSHPTLKFLI